MERGEMFPSLTVDVNSPTPYTDATQVTNCFVNLWAHLHKGQVQFKSWDNNSRLWKYTYLLNPCFVHDDLQKVGRSMPIMSTTTIVPNSPTIVAGFFQTTRKLCICERMSIKLK